MDESWMDPVTHGNCECATCFEPFDKHVHRPLNLHCGHVFCKKCTLQLRTVVNSQQFRIKCPACRAERTYTEPLSTNFAVLENEGLIQQMLNIFSSMRVDEEHEVDKPLEEMERSVHSDSPDTFPVTLKSFSFKGFGFMLVRAKETGLFTITKIIPDWPAALEGSLEVGDQIITIDGQNVQKATTQHVQALLERASNSMKVDLVIKRQSGLPRLPSLSSMVPTHKKVAVDVSAFREREVVIERRDEEEVFGFVVQRSEEGPNIVHIYPYSPAGRCGTLHRFDRLIAINGVNVLHKSKNDIIEMIKASGLSLRLTIADPGQALLAKIR